MIFAFYGTLRPGQYNYDRLDLNKHGKTIGTHLVKGYKMVSVNGWYPKVYPSQNQDDTITVELVEITDKHTIDFIDIMESGAGYDAKEIDVDGTKAYLYVGSSAMPKEAEKFLIPSGDWVKYDTDRQNAVRTSSRK